MGRLPPFGAWPHHGAAFAQEEPCSALRQRLFELGDARVIEAGAWQHGLPCASHDCGMHGSVAVAQSGLEIATAHRDMLSLCNHSGQKRDLSSLALV